jgi:hypothetical protein
LDEGELWASAQGAEEGEYALLVAGPDGEVARFASDVRGHGLARHPALPERVVLFARRPGRVGLVADVVRGEVLGHFESAPGRHQVGHGCFVDGGALLVVAEADDVTGQGTLAVFDAETLQRVREIETHGVGPHEVALMPDEATLVVANGGLVTAPGGRDPINLDTMHSSLVFVDLESGARISEHTVPEPKASLRHLAVADDGTVVVVMQIQRDALSDTEPRPLVAVRLPGEDLVALDDGVELGAAMQDYAGAVAVAGRIAAVTSPRGDLVGYWDLDTGASLGTTRFGDVSGVAASADGTRFILTGAGGQVRQTDAVTLEEDAQLRAQLGDVRWDNHLVTLR